MVVVDRERSITMSILKHRSGAERSRTFLMAFLIDVVSKRSVLEDETGVKRDFSARIIADESVLESEKRFFSALSLLIRLIRSAMMKTTTTTTTTRRQRRS